MPKYKIFFWVYVDGFRQLHKLFNSRLNKRYLWAAFMDELEQVCKGFISLLTLLFTPLFYLLTPIWIPLFWILLPLPEAFRCTFRPKDKSILLRNIELIKKGEYRK